MIIILNVSSVLILPLSTGSLHSALHAVDCDDEDDEYLNAYFQEKIEVLII